MSECKYEIKPLPFAFCAKCLLNGCYPWNRNPLLLCSKMGGLHPVLLETKEDGSVTSCICFKPVTDEMWQNHLSDLKDEAEWNEELRERAIRSKVYSSELLPAEYLQRRGKT